jgi:hypothetical protein
MGLERGIRQGFYGYLLTISDLGQATLRVCNSSAHIQVFAYFKVTLLLSLTVRIVPAKCFVYIFRCFVQYNGPANLYALSLKSSFSICLVCISCNSCWCRLWSGLSLEAGQIDRLLARGRAGYFQPKKIIFLSGHQLFKTFTNIKSISFW